MLSRSTLAAAVAVSALSGLVNAHAATTGNPPPAEMPRANCSRRLIDPEGDARWPVQLGQNGQNFDGLDINGVLLRMTPEQLQVFISVKDLVDPANMPQTAGAFVYAATFKIGEVVVTFKMMENSSRPPWTNDATKSNDFPVGGTGVTGKAAAFDGFTADEYYDTNYVVFTAPRASVETAIGAPIVDGGQFTSIAVTTFHYIDQTSTQIDKLDVPVATASYTVPDDYCFGAPPGSMSDLVTPPAVYTDPVMLSAKLVNEAGTAVAGKPVQFTVAGEKAPLVGTTGTDGVASVKYTPTLGAGTYAVDARFAGDTEVGHANLAGTVTVKTETSAFNALQVTKPSATTRTVTATLLDNDKQAIAGQKVDWYVNGKKVATLTTDSKGKSVYKGAKPTQSVYAKYLGLAGKYTAATAKAVKV